MMNNSAGTEFRMVLKRVVAYVFFCIIILSVPVILINSAFFPVNDHVPLIIKIAAVVATIFFILFALYAALYPPTSILKISKAGIFYSNIGYSLFCEWKNINSIGSSSTHLLIQCDHDVEVKRSFIFRMFNRKSKPDIIPLSEFVNNWRKLKDWQKDPVLLEIQKKLPLIPKYADRIWAGYGDIRALQKKTRGNFPCFSGETHIHIFPTPDEKQVFNVVYSDEDENFLAALQIPVEDAWKKE
jgi:hypothetical protein